MNHEQLSKCVMILNQLSPRDPHFAASIFELFEDLEALDLFLLLSESVRQHKIRRSMPIGALADALIQVERIEQHCGEEGIKYISAYHDDFPEALKFKGAPSLIYYRGDLSLLNHSRRAAVIGTRYPNTAGREFAYNSAKFLTEYDYVVISGLAEGCDTAAHEACLDAGGKTIAFLPCNIAQISPSKNKDLADRILDQGGLLISQYGPFEIQNASMYAERDRLQAGTSEFLISSEFDPNSGTLLTLTYAKELNRPIYTSEELIHQPSFTGYPAALEQGIPIEAVSRERLIQILKSRGSIEDGR